MKKQSLLSREQIAQIQRGQREFERIGQPTRERILSPRYQRKFAGLKALAQQLRGQADGIR